jgi:hypothetical protein
MAHDGGLERSVETLHESVSRGMVGGRPRELNTAQFGQGLEELRYELASLVSVDGLWAAKAGYPAGQ